MDPMQTKLMVITFTVVGLAFAAGFVMVAVWAIRAGQFKDVEGVKYRMLDDFNAKGDKQEGGEFKKG